VPLFKKKPPVVEATQWFRNGDHPMDQSAKVDTPSGPDRLTEGAVVRFFNWLHIPGDRYCPDCGNQMRKHGIIDGLNGEEELVHPGDYIVTHSKGYFYRRSQKEFEEMYEELVTPETPNQLVT
jgi:hypothetical protein